MLTIISWTKGSVSFSVSEREEFSIYPSQYLSHARDLVEQAKTADLYVYTLDVAFFDALRLATKENWCSNRILWYDDLQLVRLTIDENGRVANWPDGFMDYHLAVLRLLL